MTAVPVPAKLEIAGLNAFYGQAHILFDVGFDFIVLVAFAIITSVLAAITLRRGT